MSGVHQRLNERAQTLQELQNELRNIATIQKHIEGINKQITELERFFLQTELMIMSLEEIESKASASTEEQPETSIWALFIAITSVFPLSILGASASKKNWKRENTGYN